MRKLSKRLRRASSDLKSTCSEKHVDLHISGHGTKNCVDGSAVRANCFINVATGNSQAALACNQNSQGLRPQLVEDNRGF